MDVNQENLEGKIREGSNPQSRAMRLLTDATLSSVGENDRLI